MDIFFALVLANANPCLHLGKEILFSIQCCHFVVKYLSKWNASNINIGMLLTFDLMWSKHTESICAKAKKLSGMISLLV